MAQGAAGAVLAGGPLWASGGKPVTGTMAGGGQHTALWGGGGGLDGAGSCSRGAHLTCCWAWILMYSALCLPCLPLSGLPAWPWAAFSLEAPGVTTFMGGTLPPPLCGKKSRVRLGGGGAHTGDPGTGRGLWG